MLRGGWLEGGPSYDHAPVRRSLRHAVRCAGTIHLYGAWINSRLTVAKRSKVPRAVSLLLGSHSDEKSTDSTGTWTAPSQDDVSNTITSGNVRHRTWDGEVLAPHCGHSHPCA